MGLLEMNINSRTLPRLAILPLMINAVLAHAQEVEVKPEESKKLFEVIEVTAQKRSQNINEVAVSVNAFSANELDALGIQQATDVLNFTPGATVTTLGQGTPVYTIRGIGFDDYNANSTSTVGVNVDEIALPYPILTRTPQFDVQRVEILKGPQGTLYGRNTTGGAVNIILNKAQFVDEGFVKAGIDSDGAYSLEGAINSELSDNVAGRLSFYNKKGGAWQTNAADTSQKNGDADVQVVRGQLLWDITDDISLNLMTEYHQDKGDHQIPKYQSNFHAYNDGYASAYVDSLIENSKLPDPSDADSVAWDPKGNTFAGANPDGKFNKDNSGLLTSARLDWNIDGLQFTSLTSYNSYQRDEANAWDGVAITNWDSHNVTDLKVWSQELRLSSFENEDFTWITGLYFAGDTLDEISTGSAEHASPNIFIVPDDLVSVGYPTNDMNGDGVVDVKDSQFVGWATNLFSNKYTQKTLTKGAFFHTETTLTDELSLTLAARYSSDESKVIDSCTYDIDGTIAAAFENFGLGTFVQGQCMTLNPDTFASEAYNKTITSTNVSGKIGLSWQASDDTLIFTNVSTGYKSGGFGALAASTWDSLREYKPEEVTTLELGIKTSLTDDIQVNAAVYNYDYKDKQVSAFIADPVFGSLGKIVNAPKAQVTGAELEVNWYVTDNTVIRLTSSYLITAEYKEFSTILFGNPVSDPEPIKDLAGQRLQNTPEFQHNILVHHEVEVSDGLYAFVGGDLNYSSEFFAVVGNNSNSVVDSYAILSLRAGISDQDGVWSVSANVKNATDKDYFTSASYNNDTITHLMGRGRFMSVDFQYNWE